MNSNVFEWGRFRWQDSGNGPCVFYNEKIKLEGKEGTGYEWERVWSGETAAEGAGLWGGKGDS